MKTSCMTMYLPVLLLKPKASGFQLKQEEFLDEFHPEHLINM